jgi:hypothetical protein
VDLGVGGVLQVLGGCARAHPSHVAPELVSELETRSRAFICNCSHCSLEGFVGAVIEGPKRRTRGGSEWEPIKILLQELDL